MSLIDWSDPQEMLDLFIDFVADEIAEAAHDPARNSFLRQLRADVDDAGSLDAGAMIAALAAIDDSQPREFADDPALVHLRDCIAELKRIEGS